MKNLQIRIGQLSPNKRKRLATQLNEILRTSSHQSGIPAATPDKRLVAYVACETEADNLSAHLRDFLREMLPAYMVPSTFVLLPSLPLGPNGKIDRQALPDPEQAGSTQEFVAPRTPAEEALAEIWTEVLDLDLVGVYDNFFELGGHSLLVTQTISRVREAFEVELPLRTLFEAPTIAKLSVILEQRIIAELDTLSEAEAELAASVSD